MNTIVMTLLSKSEDPVETHLNQNRPRSRSILTRESVLESSEMRRPTPSVRTESLIQTKRDKEDMTLYVKDHIRDYNKA